MNPAPRVVRLQRHDREFTFTTEPRGALELWRVTTPGYMPYLAPVVVSNDEPAGFFETLADTAWAEMTDS